MADDIGGIRAEVTADASSLFGVLQRSEQIIRQFESRFGRINVQITATAPTVASLRETRQAIQRGMQQAGAVQVPVAVTPQITRPAAPVAVAAQVPDPRIAAQERANATQRAAQFRTPEGGIGRVFPTGGGPVGGAGGESFGGVPLPPGARGFLGRGEDVPRALEEAARLRAENERLRVQVTAGGLSQAQIEQRREAGRAGAAAVGRDPGTGRFISQAQVAPEILRPDIPQTIAAEVETFNRGKAELVALARALGGTSTEFLENLGPEAIQRQLATVRRSNPQLFEQFFTEALSELQRSAATEAQGLGRARIGPTPEERAQIVAANPLLAEARAARQAGELARIQAQTATTIRAPGTFLGGLLATQAGRGEAVEVQRELGRAMTQQDQISRALIQTTFQRTQVERQLNQEQDPEKRAALIGRLQEYNEQINRQTEGLRSAKTETELLNARARELAGGGLRNLVAGFVGGIGASLAFGVGITAISGAVEVVGRAFGQGLNVLTGYRSTTDAVSATLAEQTRQQHGLVEAVTASAFAQAGLGQQTADTIRPFLEQRAAIEAGAKAFGEQIDLIRAFQRLQEQQRQGGGIPGISTGIGGLFGTPLFAQPGIIEQLGRTTPRGQAREAGGVVGGIGGALGGAALGFAVGGPIGAGVGLLGGGAGGFFAGRDIGGAVGGGTRTPADVLTGGGFRVGPFTLGQPSEFAGTTLEDRVRMLQEGEKGIDAFGLAVQDLNEAAERGAPNLRSLGQAVTGATEAEVKRTKTLLEALGVDPEQVENLRQVGFALQGITDVRGARTFFEAAGRGAAIPERGEALQRLREQEIPARRFQLLAGAELQRGLQQIQAGVQRAAQPPLPLGATIPGGAGALSGGLRTLFQGLGPFPSPIERIDRIQVGRIEAARVEIARITAPLGPGAQAGAADAFGRVQGLGRQAGALQQFIVGAQVGLATAQFNEQIRQARLSASDLAAAMSVVRGHSAAIATTNYDNLGNLQGQLILMQRQSAELQVQTNQLGLQSQELQLQLAQRQINFRLAVAGFTAPGTTPEERAARIEEAKIEASFAQRQLDIQKEILANQQTQAQLQAQTIPVQFAIQDLSLSRDYVTARNALDLLTRGRQVTIDVAGAQEALGRINAEIEIATEELNTYLQAASEFQASLIADQAKFIATYRTSTETLLDTATDFLEGISTSYSGAVNQYLKDVTTATLTQINRLSGSGTRIRPNIPEGPGFQEGFLGGFSKPTSITVGEAGHETVAVLRNPRELLAGGGGSSGPSITIMVTGNHVSDEADEQRLAQRIAYEVERIIGRRASQQGFRFAGR